MQCSTVGKIVINCNPSKSFQSNPKGVGKKQNKKQEMVKRKKKKKKTEVSWFPCSRRG
jgi:hypothetical protein